MHERLEPILRETYGVMIYQEQVMMAARELAGFTMSEADILRAAMGKKDKPKMAKLRTKFIAGALEREIPQATADALFDGIAKFAEYGFNRAHSAAYGVIAYQTAYLKANYPLEYMTSLLIHMEGNADRVATAIVDCRTRGIEVLPPDINASQADFSMVEGRHPVRAGRDQERGAARGGVDRRAAQDGRFVQNARRPVREDDRDPGRQPAGARGAGAVGGVRLAGRAEPADGHAGPRGVAGGAGAARPGVGPDVAARHGRLARFAGRGLRPS